MPRGKRVGRGGTAVIPTISEKDTGMKQAGSVLGCIVFSALLFSCGAQHAGVSKPKLETFMEKYSYMIGQDMGRYIRSMNKPIDTNALVWGILESLQNRPPLLAESVIDSVKRAFSTMMQQEQAMKMKESSEKNTAAGNLFLAENKKKKGVITTASGLQYEVIKQGAGPKPSATDVVKVHYRGTLTDNSEFDSSYKRGEPAEFPVSGLIKGWTEALLLMQVGSKYRLVIPPALAYGANGAPPKIGPNAVLVFEMELLDIVKKQ